MSKPDLSELRRMAEKARYLTVDAYGPVPVRGDELLELIDELESARQCIRRIESLVLDDDGCEIDDVTWALESHGYLEGPRSDGAK